MKKLLSSLLVMVALVACTATPQKKAVLTLNGLGQSVNQAYEGYLYEVLKGDLPTNDVPTITKYFNNFQTSFGVAVTAAQVSTNMTLANPDLLRLASEVTSAIATIKGRK